MLVFKAAQVVVVARQEPKPWEFGGKAGISHSAKMAVIGMMASAENIVLKAKTAEELEKKIAMYPANGKPVDIVVREITPVFKQGERKPSGYEFTA